MKHIINNREVNIDWEKDEIIDKHDSGCEDWAVRGESDNGSLYYGQGNYQDDELIDVFEIEEQ